MSATLLAPPVDRRALRTVLGRFPTGVTVVTAEYGQRPVGITANSFTSVSLDPPLVLVCIATASRRLELVRRAGTFAVNILAEDQEHLSRAFAAHPHAPFVDLDTTVAATGSPILTDALAFLDCRLAAELPAGDHLILLGEILASRILRDNALPLVFSRGAYAKLV